MYLDLLFLGLVVGCAEVMQVSAEPLDVCRAVQVKSARALTVRGTGEIGRDGLVIGDVTCSVAKSGELKIPALIIIDVHRSDSVQLQAKYKKLQFTEDAPLLQVLARGNLACKLDFRTRRNETGEILGGNGFGSEGLVKCKLSSAQLIQLEEVYRPGPSFERK